VTQRAASDAWRLTRREMLPLVVGGVALATLLPAATASAQRATAQLPSQAAQAGSSAPPGTRYIYVGTYTAPHTAPGGTVPSTAGGVYVFRMDGESGALTPVQIEPGIENPSWVTVDPQSRWLYAISEVDTWRGQANSGGITAYSIDPTNGTLTRINDQPTMGAIPAHAVVDPSGRYVLVANYTGANFVVLPIESGGGLGPAIQVVPVTGNGPDPDRQTAPFGHQIQFDPASKFVLGNDLGTDRVWVWAWDGSQGKLAPDTVPAIQVASGSGPRHSAFHPSGRFLYVIGEMASSITAYRYDATKGTGIWRQTVSTLPADFTGRSTTAEIMMHPTGRWLYGSNRGHDSIVGYRVDQNTGALSVIDWWSTQGNVPRGFTIDPTGSLLLAGNQNSDTVVPFRIDPNSGGLTPTNAVTNTQVPVSFAFGRAIGA
jgi:6-phosphogluconolactonase